MCLVSRKGRCVLFWCWDGSTLLRWLSCLFGKQKGGMCVSFLLIAGSLTVYGGFLSCVWQARFAFSVWGFKTKFVAAHIVSKSVSPTKNALYAVNRGCRKPILVVRDSIIVVPGHVKVAPLKVLVVQFKK